MAKKLCCFLLLALVLSSCREAVSKEPILLAESFLTGSWLASLKTPGGELPFGIDFKKDDQGLWRAWLRNGSEAIEIPRVEVKDTSVVLGVDHYDSEGQLQFLADGRLMAGTWRRRRSKDLVTVLPCQARAATGRRFADPLTKTSTKAFHFSGSWRADFEKEEADALAQFQVAADGSSTGTFLTTTGDYRYLAGHVDGRMLRLSCFDGAHAFLFNILVQDGDSVVGEFRNWDSWHDRFTLRRDEDFRLADPFAATKWNPDVQLADLNFRDLAGRLRNLDEASFQGKARILQIFGSWCPNCHDATEFMNELVADYGPAGLSVLGLAFEVTGDFQRDALQVKRYAQRHQVSWPLLLAGTANKKEASRQFRALDAIRSYPTTVFLRRDGSVRAVYSGFSGPATGPAYEGLKTQFRYLVAELLKDS